ncbi:hypothetical protein PSENEW3_00003467 [Picochlorum sp. SENEW3]|nr:hypothetical protein PSENEW3_00003467 [Picochlorum sp. SENEW3]
MVIWRGEGVKLVVTMTKRVGRVWWCQRQCPVLRSFVLTYLYDINVCAKRKEWTLSLAWSFGGMYLYDINVCAKREEWTLSLAWSFGGVKGKARRVDIVSGMVIRRGEVVTLVVSVSDLIARVWWCQRQCPVLRSFVWMYLYDINVCAKREEWTLSLAWSFGGMYLYDINVCAKREEWTLSLAWSFGGVKCIDMIVIYVQSERSGHCLWRGHSAG